MSTTIDSLDWKSIEILRALADAETRPTRQCRNCQTARQGEQETRPCPHCTAEIKLSAWPQHVGVCTGDPTDAASETDPNGDPAITDTTTQRATSPTAQTSAWANISPSQE